MATTVQMTAEELEQMEPDECRYELIRGELYRMAPTSGGHANFMLRLTTPLDLFNREHRLGALYAGDGGFVLTRDPDTVLGPDIAFVRTDRVLSEEAHRGFLRQAPDLVVEIVSPSDRASYVTDKVMTYLDAGVLLVWVVDPQRRIVTVWTPDRTARVLRVGDELDGGDVLPGFRLAVAELFPSA